MICYRINSYERLPYMRKSHFLYQLERAAQPEKKDRSIRAQDALA
jgi:hypothetical protein